MLRSDIPTGARWLTLLVFCILFNAVATRSDAQTNLGTLLGKLFQHGSQQQQQQHPSTPSDYLKASDDEINQGLTLFNAGNYSGALPLFEQAAAYNPNSSYAYNDIGACYINLNEYSAALPYLKAALRIDSTNKMANTNIELISTNDLDQGNDLINQGNYGQAIAVLEQSVAANPQNSMAYNDIGCAYMDLSEWSAAIPYLKEAIALGSTSNLPFRNLGLCCDQTSASDAIPFYTQSLQIDPTDSVIWGFRGFDYAVTGHDAQALFDYKSSLHIKPSADVYHWRGDLELTMGNDSAGYSDLRKSRALNPNLGPVIAADIKSILSQRQELAAVSNAKRRYLEDQRRIAGVVAEGPRYYEMVYHDAKQQGDSNAEAAVKSQEAEDNYNRDVALQNAWEAGDYDTLDKIQAGDMSKEDISAYDSSSSPTAAGNENASSGNDNNGGYEPVDNGSSMSDDSSSQSEEPSEVPAEAPSDSSGGDE